MSAFFKRIQSMFRNIIMAGAFALTIASTPVFAQGGGGAGDNSSVQLCQTKLEQTELKYKSGTEKMPVAFAKAIEDAKASLAAGHPTKCLADLKEVY
jgi:hypothetical protein